MLRSPTRPLGVSLDYNYKELSNFHLKVYNNNQFISHILTGMVLYNI